MIINSKNNVFNSANNFNLGSEISSFVHVGIQQNAAHKSMKQQLQFMFPLLQDDEVLLTISQQAWDTVEELGVSLESMNSEVNRIRQQFREIEEANREAARLRRIKLITQKIARRIKENHDVPHRDHQFLKEHNIKLYTQAISIRNLNMSDEDRERYRYSLADRYYQGRQRSNGFNVSSYASSPTVGASINITTPATTVGGSINVSTHTVNVSV